MKPKCRFSPSMDGRLEDRLVLSAAGAALVAVPQASGAEAQPPQTLNTTTYNNILVRIHQATVQYGRSDGGPAAQNRAAVQIGNELNRLPFANQKGLTAEVVDSIPSYRPSDFRQLYQDIHAAAAGFTRDQAVNGDVLIMKTRPNFFSDSDFFGPRAREGMTFPFPSSIWNPAATTTPTTPVVFSTRTYNSILVNIHQATQQYGRSAGTAADQAAAADRIGRQINLIPYANRNGLTAEVTGAIPSYQPSQSEQLYADIRAAASDYVVNQASARQIHIMQPPGVRFFSDTDILAPPQSRVFNQTVLPS